MKTFELMLDDLKPEAQVEFLEFMKMSDAAEGGYELFPIVVFTNEEEADDND